MEAGALAGNKKKAQQEQRTVVFVDESGLSERPHRVRTWAPRGQTPVLQYSFNWKCLSAIPRAPKVTVTRKGDSLCQKGCYQMALLFLFLCLWSLYVS